MSDMSDLKLPEKPFVTYFVMTLNRLPFLRNMLTSFHLCNVYPNYEWIISDYGSKDGTQDYLNDLAKKDDHFTVRHEDEKPYFDYLKSIGLGPASKNQRVSSISAHCRNEVRKLARGDLFFDIADDHQFIRRGNWVCEALSICEDRLAITGKDDVSAVVMRAFLLSRLFKKNNTLSSVSRTNDGVEYFVYDQKGYDVYSFMKRTTANQLGPYLEIDQLTDPKEIQAWKKDSSFFDFYTDYVKKAKQFGLKKVGLKYPYLVEFPNDIIRKFNSNTSSPFVPLFEEGEMERRFPRVSRPLSSDEIFFAKGIGGMRAPISDFQRNCYVTMKKMVHEFKSYIPAKEMPYEPPQ